MRLPPAPPSLLLLLPLLLPGARPAPSRLLRRPRPPRTSRIPVDRPPSPAWLVTEEPFCDALKARLTGRQPLLILASQLEDPGTLPRSKLDTLRLGLASRTELHQRKRHAAARVSHAQAMRVGCVLGTCQVQNLRHRLWQLKARPRGQDSSPVNPHSPHSYG